jgi:hypothetical protein
MSKFLKSTVAAAALALSFSAQALVVIDLFSTNQADLTDATLGGGGLMSQVGSAGDATILGGYRDLGAELKSVLIPGAEGSVSIGASGGVLNFSTSSISTGTGVVRWDGASSGPAINTSGLGGLNIGNVFTDAFELTTVFSDSGYTFVIDAYTSATQWSSVSVLATSHAFSIPGSVSLIPLIGFLDCTNAFPVPGVTVSCGAGGPVDFSNLGALQVTIDPLGASTSIDLTINQARVVPEPAGLALVSLALLGAAVATGRRKN